MLRRSNGLRALAAVSIGLLLTGCAGGGDTDPIPTPTHLDLSTWDAESGNGVDLLGTAEARAAVLGAVRDAKSFAMQGTFADANGRNIELSVSTSDADTSATFSVDGEATRVIATNGEAYVHPSPAIANATGLAPEGFSCVAEDHAAITMWGMLLHPRQTLAELTTDAAAVGTPTDDRIDLILGAESTQGRLSVQTSGPALPIQLTRADTAGATTLTFGSWGEEPELPTLDPLVADC